MKILISISGSIAAYKAATLASSLVKSGYSVRCTATESALKFIGQSALEGVTREPLYTDDFKDSHKISHIALAEWADLIILYPASAATLARLRMGSAENLTCAVFLANNFRVPYWIAPAMNTHMYSHPAVQENLRILKEWGCTILNPEEGILACGEVGTGKAPDPLKLAESVKEFL